MNRSFPKFVARLVGVAAITATIGVLITCFVPAIWVQTAGFVLGVAYAHAMVWVQS